MEYSPLCDKVDKQQAISSVGGVTTPFDNIHQDRIKGWWFYINGMSTYHDGGSKYTDHSGGGGTMDGFIIRK